MQTVNLEVKGNVAKLLATENLVVEHKNVETASFDVDRRVLTLPNWKKASEQTFDLLVAHEVGHALYTPAGEWDEKAPHDFINVCEDPRIEKLIGKSIFCKYLLMVLFIRGRYFLMIRVLTPPSFRR